MPILKQMEVTSGQIPSLHPGQQQSWGARGTGDARKGTVWTLIRVPHAS